MKTYIIAEAGVNHNGDINLAYKLVDEAKKAGADCIKFQTFKAENLVSKEAKLASYQKTNTKSKGTQLEMLKKLELTFKEFIEIYEYTKKVEIDFMSTAFDLDSVDFLSTLDMKYWKIPSGEITNLPYLEKIAKLNLPIMVSTGMADLEEIRQALKIIKQHNDKEVIVLHCTSEYPAPFNEVNLKAMKTISGEFKVPIGYSDHTEGILIPSVSVALGATVIEKHFTLDKSMEGPDHIASIEPHELKEMVDSIRLIESSLGNGKKEPAPSEIKNIPIVRKSIVAKTKINKGNLFTADNLTTKRPGTGISPMRWHDIIGKKANKNYEADEMIEE